MHISYLGGTGQHAHAVGHPQADLHFVLTEVGSGIVHLKVHGPGEYTFYCTVPGHREAGTVGTLIIHTGASASAFSLPHDSRRPPARRATRRRTESADVRG